MNAKLKGRLFGVIYFLLMAGCVAFNWYLLINEGYFYPKASGLCPVVAMFSLMLVAFPSLARSRPNRAMKIGVVPPPPQAIVFPSGDHDGPCSSNQSGFLRVAST